MKVLVETFRKVSDYSELLELTKGMKSKWEHVQEVITLPCDEYNYFINNLLEDYSFFTGEENYLFYVTDGDEGIFVDTQGYNYARYVGIVLAVE